MTSATTTIESEIRDLLQATREDAQRYASSHYRDANGPNSGLAMRLEAIEEALVRLAKALDRK